ncbi:MAG: LysR family transcriptional regulator [Pseudomonadota bacterium]
MTCEYACMDVPWDDLRTVLAVVRHGTLAGAAGELDLNYTTVARRIRRAEEALGQTLFERLPEGYRANDAATLIAEHAAEMEASQHGLLRRLHSVAPELSGTLTLTAPQLFIAHFLAPMLDRFDRDYPQIDLRIRASNEILDLTRREADLAIRISRSPGDTLKGLRLLEQHTASFASRSWAEQIAVDPDGMIDWIIFDGYSDVPKGIDPIYPNNRVRFRMNDMVAMSGAAQAGLGVVRMPMFLGRSLPGLEQVPLLSPQPYADVWILAHPDVWPSARVKAFSDVLVSYCRARRDNFVA